MDSKILGIQSISRNQWIFLETLCLLSGWYCSAPTRTGIGHLRKPRGVELIPCHRKPLRRTRTLRHPAQTQVWSEQVWLDTTFISQGLRSWGKLAVKTWRVKTELIILHIIITTTSILNLRLKTIAPKILPHIQCINKYWKYTQYLQHKIKQNHKILLLLLFKMFIESKKTFYIIFWKYCHPLKNVKNTWNYCVSWKLWRMPKP